MKIRNLWSKYAINAMCTFKFSFIGCRPWFMLALCVYTVGPVIIQFHNYWITKFWFLISQLADPIRPINNSDVISRCNIYKKPHRSFKFPFWATEGSSKPQVPTRSFAQCDSIVRGPTVLNDIRHYCVLRFRKYESGADTCHHGWVAKTLRFTIDQVPAHPEQLECLCIISLKLSVSVVCTVRLGVSYNHLDKLWCIGCFGCAKRVCFSKYLV